MSGPLNALFGWAFLVPLAPTLAFVVVGLFGRRMPRLEWGGWVATGAAFVALVLGVLIAVGEMLSPGTYTDRNFDWFTLSGNGTGTFPHGFSLVMGTLVDPLSAIMLIVVTVVGFLVMLYSISYMHRDSGLSRYYAELSLFLAAMLGLVLADNLLEFFLFWELVGVCSYFLIGFYYGRPAAASAAKEAFLVTRIGDVLFLGGIFIYFQQFATAGPAPGWAASGFLFVYHGTPFLGLLHPANPTLFTVAGLLILGGAAGKSAQFPLDVWLPDAMEGPTTVSALIHAATMVAAGVYLVGRVYPLFTPEVLLTIAYVGGITLFVAATVAVVMTDIKKVLAYSTVSQLGYMMLAMGVGAWGAGLLHLLTHAFFKALLFLGSGSVIYGCHHQQDMLKMGGLYPKMKITALTMLVGVLAIAGTPFFSGWYSKDEILAGAFGHFAVHKEHFLLFLLPLVTAGITTFYMFRMWFMTFTGQPRDEHVHEHAVESPWMMTAPLVLLAIMSVFVAWGAPPWVPENSWLGLQLHHHSQPKLITPGEAPFDSHEEGEHAHAVDVDFIKENQAAHANSHMVGYLALAVVLVGLAFALLMYYRRALDPADAKEQFPGVHRFLAHKWYFDELYSVLIVRPGLTVAHWCRAFDSTVIDGFVNFLGRFNVNVSAWSGRFDRGIVDGTVNLLADVAYAIGAWLRTWQTGFLRSYVLFLALAAIATGMLLYAWATTLGAQ